MVFEYKIPKFTPERVLTRPILYSIRDLPRLEQIVRYHDYSDGVIAGCNLCEDDMHIEIQNGIVKFDGRLYILNEPVRLPYQHTDAWTVVKIVFGAKRESLDFDHYTGDICLEGNIDLQANELELGRFKLKKGSRLRTKYVDFTDMDTEYDTVNLVHIRQAAEGADTLHHEILRFFAREAFPFLQETPMDAAFCANCLAGTAVLRREYIVNFICGKLQMELKEMSNSEMYRNLADILRALRSGVSFDAKRRPSKNKIMIE